MENKEGLQSKVWDGYFSDEDSIMGSWHTYRLINVPGDFILDDGGNVYEVLARQFHRDIITIWLKYN